MKKIYLNGLQASKRLVIAQRAGMIDFSRNCMIAYSEHESINLHVPGGPNKGLIPSIRV